MGTCFSSSSSRTRMEDYYYYPALYEYDKVYHPHACRDLHLQEAISSSLLSSTSETNHYPQLHNHIATRINKEEPEIKPENKPAEPSRRLCMICMEEKPSSNIFLGTSTCAHSYCTECTIRYVATKIKENAARIKCPNVECTRSIEPYTFQDLFPKDVFEHWEKTFFNHEEAAGPSKWLCTICMDEKSPSDIFRGTTSCTHYYCTECTVRYVTTKIEENIAMIKCPDVDCTRMLEPYTCRDIIPGDVFERWDKALCESLILSSEKVYCPFEDCSAMMVVDDDDQGDEVTETECPSCHRLFCAKCKVTWHAGIGCEEFQRGGNTSKKKKSSDEEDALLIQMAKKKQWRRCPSCKFYVEKIDGCVHMSCRCGFKFCYRCGAPSSYRHSCHIRSLLLPVSTYL